MTRRCPCEPHTHIHTHTHTQRHCLTYLHKQRWHASHGVREPNAHVCTRVCVCVCVCSYIEFNTSYRLDIADTKHMPPHESKVRPTHTDTQTHTCIGHMQTFLGTRLHTHGVLCPEQTRLQWTSHRSVLSWLWAQGALLAVCCLSSLFNLNLNSGRQDGRRGDELLDHA